MERFRSKTCKEEKTMRYMLAMVLALAIGVAAAVPAAFAGEENGQDQYISPVAGQAELTNLGTVAGPMQPDQIVIVEHDKN